MMIDDLMEYQFILDFINAKDGVTQELPLLRFINDEHPEFFQSLGFEPSLFKKHFFLFHHLYQLNNKLTAHNLTLIISPLEIRLCPINDASQAVGETDLLKAFYLDEANLHLSDAEVTEMQKQFWEKYLALDRKAESIKVLSLENEEQLTQKILKQRFNELAQVHHPDKGGDEKKFIKIKTAYQELKTLL